MKYAAIRSEGGLIPYDLLEQIANEQVPGQRPADFGLPKDRRLSDEIQRVWSDAQDFWDVFRRRMASPSERDPYGTTETRERWVYQLISDPQTFAYDLRLQSSAISVNGASFPISHLAGESPDAPPVHIEGFKVDLDRRRSNLRTSPRAMVQEFLNRSEPHVWGIVTNGLRFLLLRDSARTARPTYLEFDLQTILEGNHFHEFALFYRLCHRSRLPRPSEDPTKCLLEQYYQLSIEQGGRVRDKLRDGVEEALQALGTGFLRHPANQELREKIESGRLTPAEYHRQLLRLVYRLLFLMVAEERRLIAPTGEDAERRQLIYDDFYSVGRLRERTEGIVEETTFSDLWIGLKQTFSLFSDVRDQNPLGIPPLNGELFSYRAIPDLEGTQLYNHDLLKAIRRLSLFREDKALHRVNYSALDVEELGSVYESLLDFQPLVLREPEGPKFELHEGSERKTTGSYYTRPELVRELIQSALVPVIEDRLGDAERGTRGKPESEVKAAKEKAILGISVCDPACGSGHFLLEAARRLGRELARVRTEQDEPALEDFHLAVRDTISHCIYGVDLNPLAVDLCKLALWLEGHWIGKPLSFLDHRIKCGNSLIGVLDSKVLIEGIRDEAFNPVTGDDKRVAMALRKRNRWERESHQRRLVFEPQLIEYTDEYAEQLGREMAFPEDTPADVRLKGELYQRVRQGRHWWHDWTAANLWTAAFFVPLANASDPTIPTFEPFMDYLMEGRDRPQMTGRANALALELKFFHWRLEFPEVFEGGGFDVVLGNPPWERIKLQEEEHWADDPYISKAPNKAERGRRIEEYATSNEPEKSARVIRFFDAKHGAEATGKFIRESDRYPLTAVGDVNTYAVFAELMRQILSRSGRVGVLLPTGIATDDTTKRFFGDLVKKKSLVQLVGFENEAFIFPAIHHSFKFCALSMTGENGQTESADFVFLCRSFDQVRHPDRHFRLSDQDFGAINPNTLTCPIFRTRADAELTKKIYRHVPVLLNDGSGDDPWGIRFLTMFHMANDSELFLDESTDGALPLYEAKMIYHFDHRYGTYEGATQAQINVGSLPQPPQEKKQDPDFAVLPRYWVPANEVEMRLGDWKRDWLVGFRDVTSSVVERTAIFSLLPRVGVGHKIPLVFLAGLSDDGLVMCFLANVNSLTFDYITRQKIGGLSLSYFILKQLPVIPPKGYAHGDPGFVRNRVLELVYTSSDMKPFAADVGYRSDPFCWDEDRRAQLRAELDAYYAHLYGLTRDELRYILDPKDVFGEDFPSETFRVLKEKEEKQYGEYRTRRLVLAAYDALAKTDRFAGETRESAIEAPKGRSMVPIGTQT